MQKQGLTPTKMTALSRQMRSKRWKCKQAALGAAALPLDLIARRSVAAADTDRPGERGLLAAYCTAEPRRGYHRTDRLRDRKFVTVHVRRARLSKEAGFFTKPFRSSAKGVSPVRHVQQQAIQG